MAKIEYSLVGEPNFLKDPKYSFYISNILNEYEDKFLLAEQVSIQFEETFNLNPNRLSQHSLSVSVDGKDINLIYRIHRFYVKPGVLNTLPTPLEFFNSLKQYMDNTVIASDNTKHRNSTI